MRGNNSSFVGRGLEVYMEAIYELEQLITQGDPECDMFRNEIARQGGKIGEAQKDQFYVAKAKAIYNYIKEISQ